MCGCVCLTAGGHGRQLHYTKYGSSEAPSILLGEIAEDGGRRGEEESRRDVVFRGSAGGREVDSETLMARLW